jgi:glucose-1-phosphate cytidylyltransferase
MKVVLFCGGRGTRLQDYSTDVPKPMVPVGNRPIMWHLMKYYAHFGHTEFILALGYKGEVIKDFFLNYEEAVSNDFVLSGGKDVQLLGSDIAQWKITFVDTGLDTDVGDRLRAVRPHLEGDDMFLVNYADGLTDLDLDAYVDEFRESDAVAKLLSVRPPLSYHRVEEADGRVVGLTPIVESELWINGGFFVMRQAYFDVAEPGTGLVNGPFQVLAAQGRLSTLCYDGFWAPMDTFKEKQRLDDLVAAGTTPWAVWLQAGA